jgi:D-Tyr-tRNAtyr deacylase
MQFPYLKDLREAQHFRSTRTVSADTESMLQQVQFTLYAHASGIKPSVFRCDSPDQEEQYYILDL